MQRTVSRRSSSDILPTLVNMSSNRSHHKKREHNITKARSNWDMPDQRVRAAVNARDEIKDPSLTQSLIGLLPPLNRQSSMVSDGFTYSFDRTDSPNQPLSLDIFVKTTGRETERLVEREYEILDANGQALRGRKARKDLRKPSTTPEDSIIEDDGFELI
jgi:hypothetical protein